MRREQSRQWESPLGAQVDKRHAVSPAECEKLKTAEQARRSIMAHAECTALGVSALTPLSARKTVAPLKKELDNTGNLTHGLECSLYS